MIHRHVKQSQCRNPTRFLNSVSKFLLADSIFILYGNCVLSSIVTYLHVFNSSFSILVGRCITTIHGAYVCSNQNAMTEQIRSEIKDLLHETGSVLFRQTGKNCIDCYSFPFYTTMHLKEYIFIKISTQPKCRSMPLHPYSSNPETESLLAKKKPSRDIFLSWRNGAFFR